MGKLKRLVVTFRALSCGQLPERREVCTDSDSGGAEAVANPNCHGCQYSSLTAKCGDDFEFDTCFMFLARQCSHGFSVFFATNLCSLVFVSVPRPS